jgi:peptide chain release factor subunit 1
LWNCEQVTTSTIANELTIDCSDDNDKRKKFITCFEPVKPVPVFIYKCDSRFYVEPLKEMLETSNKYGFIIVDGNGCLFATVQGNSQTVLYKHGISLPKKHGRGGQSALRFARLRLEARHNYLSKINELAIKYFIDSGKTKSCARVLTDV